MECQPVLRSGLQRVHIAGRDQGDATRASDCRAGAARSGAQQQRRLPRHGFACFNQHHIVAHQRLQVLADERVMRAAKYQRVYLPGLGAKNAHSPRITRASSYYFCSVVQAGTALDGVCQAVAGSQHKLGSACLRRQRENKT